MSIAAKVIGVFEDDNPRLILGPIGGSGPDKNDKPGQSILYVVNKPCPPLGGFIGTKIWGGSNELMIGTTQIAKRIGYTKIELIEKNKKQ